MLTLKFLEDRRIVDHSRTHYQISGAGVAECIDVFKMYPIDMAFQFLQAGDGIETVAGPVADIGAGADVLVTFDGREDGIGVPVGVGFGMVVNGEVDLIDVGEAVDGIPLILEGFAGNVAKAVIFGQVEILYPLVDRAGGDDTHRVDMNACGVE